MESLDTDLLIANLDKPWMSEQFRIRKIVEDKLLKLEQEIAEDLKEKENEKKNSKKAKKKKVKDDSRTDDSHEVSKKELTPEVFEDPVSLKHFKEPKTTSPHEETKSYPVFEVVAPDPTPFLPLCPPKLVKKARTNKNVGVYEYQYEQPKTERPSILTSHIIPGVNIKPELTIEHIPGLSIPGIQTANRPNIHVVNQTLADLTSLKPRIEVEEEENSLSITNSTTSKFEQVEKALFDEQSSEKLPTEQLELKQRLRKRVREILVKKYSLDLDVEDTTPLLVDQGISEPSILGKPSPHVNVKVLKDNEKSETSSSARISQNHDSSETDLKSSRKYQHSNIPTTNKSNEQSPEHTEEYSTSFEKYSDDSLKDGDKSEKDSKDVYSGSSNEESRESSSEGDRDAGDDYWMRNQKPLSTIFEVSSGISSGSIQKEDSAGGRHSRKAINVEKSLMTEHTAVSAEPEEEDTQAPSSIELCSDAIKSTADNTDARTYKDDFENDPSKSTLIQVKGSSKSKSFQESSKGNKEIHQNSKRHSNQKECLTNSQSKHESLHLESKSNHQDESKHDEAKIVSNIICNKILESVYKYIDINDKPEVNSNQQGEVNNPKELYSNSNSQENENESKPESLKSVEHSKSKSISQSQSEKNKSNAMNVVNSDSESLQENLPEESFCDEMIIKNDKSADIVLEESLVDMNVSTGPLDSSTDNQIENVPKDKLQPTDESLGQDISEKSKSCVMTVTSGAPSLLTLGLSCGQVLPEVLNSMQLSEGELEATPASTSLNISTSSEQHPSEGEHAISQSNSNGIIDERSSRISDSESEMSRSKFDNIVESLSSGEWNASPKQIARLARFADSFKLYK